MGTKVTKVRLFAESISRTQAFEAEHAARILRITKGRWVVAPGEKVEWTGDGFRPHKNKGGNGKSQQKG